MSKGFSISARAIAVLSVALSAVAIAVVVAVSLGNSSSGGDESSSSTTAEAGKCNRGADDAVKAGYYIVQEGESLTSIGERTCIDPDELTALNPDLDTHALQIGACVNLKNKGCKKNGL